MSKFYVYTLSYPPEMEGGRVFYVGKGSGPRIDTHETWARSRSYTGRTEEPGPFRDVTRRSKAIRSIWDAGYQVVKEKVFETDDEGEAYKEEYRLITLYGYDNLTNKRHRDGFHVRFGLCLPGKAAHVERIQAASEDAWGRAKEIYQDAGTDWPAISEQQIEYYCLRGVAVMLDMLAANELAAIGYSPDGKPTTTTD